MKFPSANFETDTIFSNAGTSDGAIKGWLARHGHGVKPYTYAAGNPYTKAVQGMAEKHHDDSTLEDRAVQYLQEVTDKNELTKLYEAAVDLNMTPVKNAINTRLFQLRQPAGDEQAALAKAPSITGRPTLAKQA